MMHYPPFSAMANVLVRSEKQEEALRMSTELGFLLDPPPEKLQVHGPGRSAGAAPEERVPLSVPDQGGQSNHTQSDPAAICVSRRSSVNGARRLW